LKTNPSCCEVLFYCLKNQTPTTITSHYPNSQGSSGIHMASVCLCVVAGPRQSSIGHWPALKKCIRHFVRESLSLASSFFYTCCCCRSSSPAFSQNSCPFFLELYYKFLKTRKRILKKLPKQFKRSCPKCVVNKHRNFEGS
jgi:hypothetical protein